MDAGFAKVRQKGGVHLWSGLVVGRVKTHKRGRSAGLLYFSIFVSPPALEENQVGSTAVPLNDSGLSIDP